MCVSVKRVNFQEDICGCNIRLRAAGPRALRTKELEARRGPPGCVTVASLGLGRLKGRVFSAERPKKIVTFRTNSGLKTSWMHFMEVSNSFVTALFGTFRLIAN